MCFCEVVIGKVCGIFHQKFINDVLHVLFAREHPFVELLKELFINDIILDCKECFHELVNAPLCRNVVDLCECIQPSKASVYLNVHAAPVGSEINFFFLIANFALHLFLDASNILIAICSSYFFQF